MTRSFQTAFGIPATVLRHRARRRANFEVGSIIAGFTVYQRKPAANGRNVAEVKSARPCILLVEDEEINRVLVRTILRRSTEEELRDVELVEAGNLAAARTNLAEY